MIIDCAVYRSGARVRTFSSGDDLPGVLSSLSENEFVWIAVSSPTADELTDVGEALGLHPLVVEDMLEPHQRPKVERYRDYLLLALRAVGHHDDVIGTSEVNVCVGSRYVVTVRRDEFPIAAVRSGLEDDPQLLRHGPIAALHAVLDHIVDQYRDVALELEADVEEVEASVFSEQRTRDSQRIYRLKRESLQFRRAVMPLRDPVSELAGVVTPAAARPYLRDVADHLHHVADAIEMIDKLLDNALTAHLAQLSVRQNDDMRKLTAGATLFAVPTAIAGIYGMNFRFMPELDWRFGYPLVLAVMAALCAYIYYRFKKSGWW